MKAQVLMDTRQRLMTKEPCRYCDGHGWIICNYCLGVGQDETGYCSFCNAGGRHLCEGCEGTGYIEYEEKEHDD